MKYIFALITLVLISCNGTPNGPTYDLKSYDTESIGSGALLVSYKDAAGFYIAKGQVLNKVRNGTWNTFHPGSNNLKKVTSMINGVKNGPVVSIDKNGRLESVIEYKNDVIHGLSIKYQFGRVLEELSYMDGELDGPFAVYNQQAKLQKKGSFKNGKQHGTLEFFDGEGNITLSYEYEYGEKISGGMVK